MSRRRPSEPPYEPPYDAPFDPLVDAEDAERGADEVWEFASLTEASPNGGMVEMDAIVGDEATVEPSVVACEHCHLTAFQMLQRLDQKSDFRCCARRKVITAMGEAAYEHHRRTQMLAGLSVGEVREVGIGEFYHRIDAERVRRLTADTEILDIAVDDRTIPF